MPGFTAKAYQTHVLHSVEAYFRETWRTGNADKAFYNVTLDLWDKGIAYHPIDGFEAAMPYFCLRVPTGGGKTWLAAKRVALVNTHLQRTLIPVVTWVPVTQAIAERGDLDPLLAATALEHGLTLVTRNVKHFEHVPQLNIENWFAETGA